MSGAVTPADLRAALDAHAGPGAVATVDLGRDTTTDAFRLAVDGLGGPVPPKDQLLPLVPPGSRWAPARGWAAVIGRPLHVGGRTLFAVGVEAVQAREGGSAFPTVRAHLHAAAPVEALRAIAHLLDGGRGSDHTVEEPISAIVVRALAGRSQEATADDQAFVLRRAAELHRRGRAPLYRTVVLAEEELRPLLAIPARLPSGVDCCVLGIADEIARGFGAWTTALVQLRRWWQPV